MYVFAPLVLFIFPLIYYISGTSIGSNIEYTVQCTLFKMRPRVPYGFGIWMFELYHCSSWCTTAVVQTKRCLLYARV